jgi:hypothetical protein
MRRGFGLVSAVVAGLVCLGAAPSLVAAQEELPIGIPDLPRKVQRTLPVLKPEQEIKLGILKLHPSFLSTVTYDDNVRLAEKDGVEDVLFTETPGLIGELKLGDHRVEAGYGLELFKHVKVGEEDASNHLAHGLLELNFTDFHLTVSEAMERTTGRLFTESIDRDRLFFNTVQVLGRYDRPMWALEGGWTHNTVDHITSTFNNFDYGEDVLAVLGGYKILPKTLLLVETDVGLVNYDRNVSRADQDYWQIFTGLRGELTPKITSTIKLGFQDRQLSDVGGQGPQSDFDGLVANVDVVYTPSVSDIVRLNYTRAARTSTFRTNGWYRQDRISLSYRKRFLRKWLLTPRGSWQLHDYPELATVGGVTERRKDHFFQLGASLRYEIQEWLSTGFGYNFRSRNSNLDTLDYENNRFTFDVTVAF